MKRVLFALGTVLILATALPLVRSEEWWIRFFDFPRPQIVILVALVFVAFLFVYRPSRGLDSIFLFALAASLSYHAYRIFPYTPLATPQVVRSYSCDASSQNPPGDR
jgi:hypothetical protein